MSDLHYTFINPVQSIKTYAGIDYSIIHDAINYTCNLILSQNHLLFYIDHSIVSLKLLYVTSFVSRWYIFYQHIYFIIFKTLIYGLILCIPGSKMPWNLPNFSCMTSVPSLTIIYGNGQHKQQGTQTLKVVQNLPQESKKDS